MKKFFWSNEMMESRTDIFVHPFIKINIAQIEQISQEINHARPQLRKILDSKNQIHKLQVSNSFDNIASIDGSNTKPVENIFHTIYGVNANAFLQFNTAPHPAAILKTAEFVLVETSSFSPFRMHLDRDILEWEVYNELLNQTEPDIVFLDGSINAQALWHARVLQEKHNLYTRQNSLKDLYEEIFNTPGCLWSIVKKNLKNNCSVWIPKRTVAKSFLNRILEENPKLRLPKGITNQIFSLILNPDEYLGPVEFQEWVQSTTSIARSFAKEICTVYYKPPLNNYKAIKLEFHKNHIDKLQQILSTVRNQFSVHTNELLPISWAHNCAVSEKVDIDELNELIQIYLILKEIDPSIQNIIQFLFRKLNNHIL